MFQAGKFSSRPHWPTGRGCRFGTTTLIGREGQRQRLRGWRLMWPEILYAWNSTIPAGCVAIFRAREFDMLGNGIDKTRAPNGAQSQRVAQRTLGGGLPPSPTPTALHPRSVM